jgi:hypothetical protein
VVSNNQIDDLVINNRYADELRLLDDVTEACLWMSSLGDAQHFWLTAEHVREVRDWCNTFLDAYATLKIGGAT